MSTSDMGPMLRTIMSTSTTAATPETEHNDISFCLFHQQFRSGRSSQFGTVQIKIQQSSDDFHMRNGRHLHTICE